MTQNWVNDTYAFSLMADKDPPSPEREDDNRSFRRLRVKPAMRVQAKVSSL